ncbi:hypothetical protein GCM10023091_43400 [Ravibacter arvi]|uniref:HTH luxR-type domain-containing protein n=1 Tax=Ravibacter arvi TaxID=2051041 RepID=A0ABP8ME04_9BACT
MKVVVISKSDVFGIGIGVIIRQQIADAEIEKIADIRDSGASAKFPPEVVILCISQDQQPEELIAQLEQITQRYPASRLIVAETQANPAIRAISSQIFRWGVLGYLTSDSNAQSIFACIQTVYSGQIFLSKQLLQGVFDSLIDQEKESFQNWNKLLSKLTKTELEIARMLSEGQRITNIAAQTGKKPSTVSMIKKSIFRKTNTQDILTLHQLFSKAVKPRLAYQ